MARKICRPGWQQLGAVERFRQARTIGSPKRRHGGRMKWMSESREFSLGVVILAAGKSSRMGRPKLLLPWGATTVLGQLLGEWRRLGAAQIVVVCQPDDRAMQEELDRLNFPTEGRIVNPEPARGMSSSVQCAARWEGWKAGLTFWAVALGDQPHLRPATLDRLIEFTKRHPGKICQPGRGEHGRHPVLLPEALFKELAETNLGTLKEFLAAHSSLVELAEMDDPGLDLDMDTPEDFEKARRMFFK
jgi:molybdenum cofactor cytidylyltransferase